MNNQTFSAAAVLTGAILLAACAGTSPSASPTPAKPTATNPATASQQATPTPSAAATANLPRTPAPIPSPTPTPTAAPVLFGDPVSIAIPTDPGAVVSGDFNGDGKLDLATANGDLTVTILWGSGDGKFETRTELSGGKGPVSMAAADLNGDGRLDLVLVYSGVSDMGTGDDDLVVELAQKDGSFKKLVQPSGVNAQDLAVGDFNSDDIPDLVTADEGINASIFIGVGDGTFKAPQGFPTGAPYSSGVEVTDFNGDTKLDVVTANSLIGRGRSTRTVSVLLGTGLGTFKAPMVAFVGGSQPISPVVADLNGDRYPDVVTPNGDPSHEVSVLLGLGDGHLGTSVEYRTSADPHSAVIGDLNGDGHLDVAAWGSGVRGGLVDRGLSVIFGVGDGTFGTNIDLAATYDAEVADAVDLDGDGRLDIVLQGVNQLLLLFSTIPQVSPGATSSP